MNSSNGRDHIRREIDAEGSQATMEIVETIAEIENKDPMELTNLWGCSDHIIEHLFSDPPSPEAEMEIEFNYEGYRITVEQDGTAEFVSAE